MAKRINRADRLTFKALQKAIAKDELQIALINSKINIPSSPVYNPWEILLPSLIPAVLGLFLIWLVGIIFGLIFMVAGILLSSNLIKKKMEQRLFERSKQFFVSDYNSCNELWDFGGIVLVNSADKKQSCVSPEGNWKEFVVLNYSQYMIEPKQQETTTVEEDIKEDEKAA